MKRPRPSSSLRPTRLFLAWAAATILAAVLPPDARSQPQITSFDSNGALSWSDPASMGTNSYAVQWASSLNGNWSSWEDAVARLSGLGPSGTVSVPMFYRVVATDPSLAAMQRYTYFDELPPMDPLTPLETDEMRIIFMGSMIPLPVRRAQAEMSVFVQVGWIDDPNDAVYGGRARDQFVFDCGAGSSANYAAAKIGFRRMDKVFINHLHADHMNDLSHIYCFGPASDRKTPLYVWGSKASGVESPPGSGIYYDDGVGSFCSNLRQAMRWHTESFSFQSTRYVDYVPPTREQWGLPGDPVPVCDDDPRDAYALVPIELDWEQIGGTAYDNVATGAKITHFPVIHCRKGAMGYKLDWTTPAGRTLSMIYTGDTKPETNSIAQAVNNGQGVDVFIHEMVVPPAVWAYQSMGLNAPPQPDDPGYLSYQRAVTNMMYIQNSSHTPQGAFGYLLGQITPRPRLTVATHFPVADDTVASAFDSVAGHCPDVEMGRDIVWSFDLMAIRVFPDRIEQRRVAVSDFGLNPPVQFDGATYPPKYNDGNGNADPYLQIDISASIAPTNTDGSVNFRIDGY